MTPRRRVVVVAACAALAACAAPLAVVAAGPAARRRLDEMAAAVLDGVTGHKTFLPTDFRDAAGFVAAALGLMIAAGGGIGGGGMLVPIYVLVLGFKPKFAIPLSNMTVLGGAITNVSMNAQKRHPLADRSLVDWDLLILMEPLTLAGALVGGFVNKLAPELVITVLLVILLRGARAGPGRARVDAPRRRRRFARETAESTRWREDRPTPSSEARSARRVRRHGRGSSAVGIDETRARSRARPRYLTSERTLKKGFKLYAKETAQFSAAMELTAEIAAEEAAAEAEGLLDDDDDERSKAAYGAARGPRVLCVVGPAAASPPRRPRFASAPRRVAAAGRGRRRLSSKLLRPPSGPRTPRRPGRPRSTRRRSRRSTPRRRSRSRPGRSACSWACSR